MQIETLCRWLKQQFAERANEFGLIASGLQIRYIFNPGGFVNSSFEVTDGHTRNHLKITRDRDNLSKFQTWHAAHEHIEERYHAPRLIRWMDFPEIGFAGFLSEFIDGQEPDFGASPKLLHDVLATLDRLHSDESLAKRLANPGRTYRDSFIETYIDRFTADLAVIGPRRPSFVSEELVEWMRSETERLADIAHRSKVFAQPATEPIHGDLHHNNFILSSTDWYLFDWDDLAIGDPALDFVILTWPLRLETTRGDTAFHERCSLYRRAQLLDIIIDPLADYIEAPSDLDRLNEVQAAKRLEHEESLEQYRRQYE